MGLWIYHLNCVELVLPTMGGTILCRGDPGLYKWRRRVEHSLHSLLSLLLPLLKIIYF